MTDTPAMRLEVLKIAAKLSGSQSAVERIAKDLLAWVLEAPDVNGSDPEGFARELAAQRR